MSAKVRHHTQEGFSGTQLRLLSREMDPGRVRHRQTAEGVQIAYIEGWFAIAEANAVFGYAGWEREVVHFERVFEQRRADETSCGYVVRVKITVSAGGRRLVREGTGFGQARARTPGDAHERAVKAAETDATKRALSTFGNRFGLGLYGKDAPAIISGDGRTREPNGEATPAPADGALRQSFKLWAPDGTLIDQWLSPEAFCAGFRQLIAKCDTMQSALSLSARNDSEIAKVAALGLRSPRGTLYSDILKRLLKRRQESLPTGPDVRVDGARTENRTGDEISSPADNGRMVSHSVVGVSNGALVSEATPSHAIMIDKVDKSVLPIGIEKRIRDKDHLRAVAQMPCVICSRQPSHAHHLKFAQRHGLSQKVSDEYAVPLCALHHGDLHRAAREEYWWRQNNVDPLPIALELWTRHLTMQS